MRKTRFTEEQMVKILREADSTPVADVAKKHGISDQTIYVWRKRFGAMDVADAKRLKTLETENGRLKRLLAERDLEIEVMKEIAAGKIKRQARPPDACRSNTPGGGGCPAAGHALYYELPVPRWTTNRAAPRRTRPRC